MNKKIIEYKDIKKYNIEERYICLKTKDEIWLDESFSDIVNKSFLIKDFKLNINNNNKCLAIIYIILDRKEREVITSHLNIIFELIDKFFYHIYIKNEYVKVTLKHEIKLCKDVLYFE